MRRSRLVAREPVSICAALTLLVSPRLTSVEPVRLETASRAKSRAPVTYPERLSSGFQP